MHTSCLNLVKAIKHGLTRAFQTVPVLAQHMHFIVLNLRRSKTKLHHSLCHVYDQAAAPAWKCCKSFSVRVNALCTRTRQAFEKQYISLDNQYKNHFKRFLKYQHSIWVDTKLQCNYSTKYFYSIQSLAEVFMGIFQHVAQYKWRVRHLSTKLDNKETRTELIQDQYIHIFKAPTRLSQGKSAASR